MLQRATQKEDMVLLTTPIMDLTDSLQLFSDEAETDFILLGIGLQSVHTNVSELTHQMLDTARRIGGDEEGGVLSGVEKIVNESLGEIKSCQDQADTNLTQINALVERLGDLYAISEEIKKFAKFLHAVALNIFVENSRTDESFKLFADIAQEIKDLSGMITNIANGVYENVESARAIHVSIHDKISNGMKQLHGLTQEAHQAVQESIAEAGQLMSFSVKTIEDAGMRSQEISGQVSEIVMGVQFHDNMRQRIEQIIKQLNDLSGLYPTDGSVPVSIHPETPDNEHVCSLIRSQGAELSEIISEVDYVFHQNKCASKEIKREVEELVQGFLGLTSPDNANCCSGIGIADDPFASLKTALTQLHQLLDQGKSLFEQLQGAAVQAADIATKLSEQLKNVRDISRDTHIKALNSIIAADRLGEKGRTLKVLAHEMKDLAAQSDVFVDDVEVIIESIAVSAREIGANGIGQTEEKTILTLDNVIKKISQEYDQFRENSEESFNRAKDLKKAITATIISLDFFKGLSINLTDYYGQLENIYKEYNRGEGFGEDITFRPEIIKENQNGIPEKNHEFGDNVELF